jgi:hypothetical protein
MKTIFDNPLKILEHIRKNNLNEIWSSYSTPKSIDAIRLNAYTPIYEESYVKYLSKKCTRMDKNKVICNGTLQVPEEDIERNVIHTLKCSNPKCRKYKRIIYRWINSKDKHKLHFNTPEKVDEYATQGRAFYGTLSLHDKQVIQPKVQYVNEKLIKACSLGIDIDIKSGNILDLNNREDLQKTIDIVSEELNTFIPNSYNIQTSGNGVQILVHHNLCRVNVFETMAKMNGLIIHLDSIREEKGITKTKIDPLNTPGRLFKLIGSPHQKYDLVCIPINENLMKMESNEFKLENFNINKYRDDNKKLLFYNKCDVNETKSLYEVLDKNIIKHPEWGERALRYKFKDVVELTTNQKQDFTPEEELEFQNQIDEETDRIFGWKKFNIETPGRVHYKEKENNFIIQIYASDNDKQKILKEFKNKVIDTKLQHNTFNLESEFFKKLVR